MGKQSYLSPPDCVLPDNPPQLLKRYAHLLCALSKSTVREARKLISIAPAGLIKAIALIAKNILHKKIELGGSLNPTPYAKQIRKLALKRLSNKKKRLILSQSGGFLNLLLPIISAIVPTILGAL